MWQGGKLKLFMDRSWVMHLFWKRHIQTETVNHIRFIVRNANFVHQLYMFELLKHASPNLSVYSFDIIFSPIIIQLSFHVL